MDKKAKSLPLWDSHLEGGGREKLRCNKTARDSKLLEAQSARLQNHEPVGAGPSREVVVYRDSQASRGH